MTSNKVNIFDFATSELSHDAILCYILKGINGVDFRLNEASKRLYKKIFKYSENLEAEKFEDICVKRQVRADKKDNGRYGIIDILVTLKYSGNPHVIVIEDKIDTDEHGNQLDIYSNFIAENFKDYTVKMVFITQKYKSILSKHRMNERGWITLDRNDLFEMIEVQKDKEKQVIFQYYDFIDRLVKDGDDFVNKPTNQWNYNQAESFYRNIDQKEKIAGFDFGSVNGFTLDNERGRMLSAWFDHERMIFKEVAFDVYLQIEFYSKIDSMSCNSKQVIDSSFYLSLRLQRYDSLKSLDQKGISLVKNKEIKRAIREGVKNYFRGHPEFMEPSNKNEKLNDYQSSVIGKKELKGSYNHIIEEVIDTSIVFKSLVTNLQKYLDTLESMS